MSGRQIVTSTVWQLVSQATMALLSVITVKCVAVGLSVELAGYYNSAYGFLQLFAILADFGLYAVSIREVSRAQDKEKVLGALLVLRCSILLLSLGSAVILVWLLPAWRATPLPLAVCIASLVPAFTLLAGVLRAVFQVHHKMQYVFIAEVTQRIVTVALLGSTLLLGLRGSIDVRQLFLFLGYGAIGALVLLTLAIIFSSRITRVRPVFDAILIKKLLRLSLPYGVAFLFMALYRQTDVSLIALLRSDFAYQNAVYGFVQRVMDMAYLFPTFLLNSTLPHLKPDDERSKFLLSRTLIGTLLLSGACALFSWYWATPLMALLTTDAYLTHPGQPGADLALRLLSISMFCNGFIVFGFYALLSVHAWRWLVWILGGGAVLALCLNMSLIPSLGFIGASVTSVCVHVALAIALFAACMRATPFPISWNGMWRWALWMMLLAIALVLLLPFLTTSVRTLLGLAIAGSFALLLAWLLGLLRILLKQETA